MMAQHVRAQRRWESRIGHARRHFSRLRLSSNSFLKVRESVIMWKDFPHNTLLSVLCEKSFHIISSYVASLMNEVSSPFAYPGSPDSEQQPPQIGGWLIVIAIGLAISLLQNLNNFLRALSPLVGPVWVRLTDPASPRYHPYWRVALIYEAVAACLYLVMNLIAIILFVSKRRLFPVLTVVFLPSIFVLGLVDHYLTGLIPAVAESATHSKGAYVLAAKFVALHAWIPYFLVSKRVKATFVR